MVFKKRDVVRETIVFNGRRYNRYPESKNPAHRKYFARAGRRLHRDVWEFHNGPIPEGYHVHHIDGDTTNNDISNLCCLPAGEHRRLHRAELSERSKTPEHLEHLASIRDSAAAWHSSEEGRAWHREHAKTSLVAARKAREEKGPPVVAFVCYWCGSEGVGNSPKRKLCSSKCQSAASRFRTGKSRTQHPYYASRVRSGG